MPTKWLQERADGSKNGHGTGFERPSVGCVCLELSDGGAYTRVDPGFGFLVGTGL